MIYGLVGEKLPHSFSKEIHEKIGLYKYELCEVAKDDFDFFAEKKDFTGINITIPYKQSIIPHLYFISDKAKAIGAVNVAINKDGKLYGYNTDFEGLRSLILREGFDFSGKTVLILGTGGTSKTARAVAEDLGALNVVNVSRRESAGAVTFGEAVLKYGDADFIINTTPSGMYPETENIPYDMDLSAFASLSGVIDVIYNPISTKLVNSARKLGISAVGGLYMLVSQAVAAAELFTGEKLGKEVCEKIYRELLWEKENIVLVGMPGSGKSTVGALLSERLGKAFYDTDEELSKKIGNISEYINKNGEAAFRKAESETIKELAGKTTGAVISTGGGAVLKYENVEALRRNGRIYFIDRDISLITPTKSRPLSSNREKLQKLYNERYEIYLSSCDKRIENNGSPEECADKITEDIGK